MIDTSTAAPEGPAASQIAPTPSVSHGRSTLGRLWGLWPRWAAWGAIVWSTVFTTFGAVWWSGWRWYPFASVRDDRSSASVFEGVSSEVMGPMFTVLGVLGVISGFVMVQEHARPALRRAAMGYGVVAAILFTCLVPDYMPLGVLAMWPALVVFAFTGVPGAQDGLGDILYWHRVNLLLIFVGGLLWAAATVAHRRRMRGACGNCGRADGTSSFTASDLMRWGRIGVWLAVLSTLPYDITRLAWFLGWPLGLTASMYESLQDPPGLLAIGLVLGLMSTGGALLTHGLVARWGERFPRWMPRLAGRRVPVMLAVIPAATVAVTLPSAAMLFLLNTRVNEGFSAANWATWLPSLFWLLWAVGLALATYCYHLRRRGRCRHCGRGRGELCLEVPGSDAG